MHIAVAGNIGSGKTTLTKLLAHRYNWTPRYEPVDNNPYLADQGMMSDRDFANYTDLFDLMMSLVKLPDLMIYIRSSIPTLVSQIAKRGREYEQSIRLDYLQGLEKRYEEWIATYRGPLIIVDGDNCKFGDRPEDFKMVCELIDQKLYGLFPLE